jgi:DNA end-binding protein Ku
MRFADELVDIDSFSFPGDKEIRKTELDMAKMLVESLSAKWDPTKYTDQYRENLLRVIRGKLKGRRVQLEPQVEPRQAEVVDLMERLRRSLEKAAPHARSAKAKRSTPPKRRAKHAA